MRHAPLPTLLVALSCFAGCSVEVCEGETPPEPFAEIAGDLPSEAVFCKVDPEQTGLSRVEFPEPGGAWPEGMLPNTAHLNFDLDTPHDAWIKLVDTLEAKGWERIDQTTGEMLTLTFGHVEKGVVLDFNVINSNSAKNPIKKDRVHAHLVVHKVPCVEVLGGKTGQSCLDNTLVTCVNGWPTSETDCAANNQSCGQGDFSKAACVSDLCLVEKASSGKWNPESCPAELVGP